MQTQKDEIKERIIAVARQEFIANGVKNTSMQRIASLSGIAVGNIYHYFKSKDHLFRCVIHPLLKAFETYRQNANQSSYASLDIFRYDSYLEGMKELVTSLVVPYRDELKLLLNEAADTSLHHAVDKMIEQQSIDGMNYIKRMKQQYPCINDQISPHFLRVLCNLWKEVIKEIVMHDNLTSKEQESLILDYVKFDVGGRKYMMNIQDTLDLETED